MSDVYIATFHDIESSSVLGVYASQIGAYHRILRESNWHLNAHPSDRLTIDPGDNAVYMLVDGYCRTDEYWSVDKYQVVSD